MSVIDLQKRVSRSPLHADVCLVGAGPASWAIAWALRNARLRVLMLESGGANRPVIPDDQCRTEDVGVALFNGRVRGLGGTTQHSVWGARCVALDEIDYEPRPWVPLSGWPIGADAVRPFLDPASELLGAGPYRLAEADVAGMAHAPHPPPAQGLGLRHLYWNFGEQANGDKLRIRDLIRRDKPENLDIVVNATVVDVDAEEGGRRYRSLAVADPAGALTTVISRVAVLCAGGVENARLLLNSDRQVSTGLGNAHDMVGRHLTDHPRDLGMAVTFDPAAVGAVRSVFGPFRFDTGSGSKTFVGGLALSAEDQARERLLNCAAWPIEEAEDADSYSAFLRVTRARGKARAEDVRRAAADPAAVVRGLRARMADQPTFRRPSKVGLVISSEQISDPDSRVMLSDQRDRFGLRIARTDWRFHEEERRSQARLARLIAQNAERLGLPQAKLADWVLSDSAPVHMVDGCHPSGTTRMSTDPRQGVVDADGQVHGVSGLYLAGSSVFPTNGHANPTLSIVALALRLAEHLRQTLQAGEHAAAPRGEARPAAVGRPVGREAPEAAELAGARVAITGATGFLGRRLAALLASEGAFVTRLVRRPVGDAASQGDPPSSVQVDLADAAGLSRALDGVRVLFHCAYDWKDEDANLRAVAAIIDACLERDVRLVHVSTYAIYHVPASGELSEEGVEQASGKGYAGSKIRLEAAIRDAVRDRGLKAAIIQPANIYGPGSGPWANDPADMLKFGSVVLPDDGEGASNLVYVDDVAQAMILAAVRTGALGETFLVGPSEVVTWRRFYGGVASAVGAQGPRLMPTAEIERLNRKVERLKRAWGSPGAVARRLASRGPVRRLVRAVLRVAPGPVRRALEARLYPPWQRVRGHVHVPDPGRALWLSSRATVSSDKAARLLGYRPRFDFASGLASTDPYLKRRFEDARR